MSARARVQVCERTTVVRTGECVLAGVRWAEYAPGTCVRAHGVRVPSGVGAGGSGTERSPWWWIQYLPNVGSPPPLPPLPRVFLEEVRTLHRLPTDPPSPRGIWGEVGGGQSRGHPR